MDPAILSATSALTGSLIGGISTFAASSITQRRQVRFHRLVEEITRRENLYSDFITEAAKLLSEAWSKHAEQPDVLAGVYASIERMRLISSTAVIDAAALPDPVHVA